MEYLIGLGIVLGFLVCMVLFITAINLWPDFMLTVVLIVIAILMFGVVPWLIGHRIVHGS